MLLCIRLISNWECVQLGNFVHTTHSHIIKTRLSHEWLKITHQFRYVNTFRQSRTCWAEQHCSFSIITLAFETNNSWTLSVCVFWCVENRGLIKKCATTFILRALRRTVKSNISTEYASIWSPYKMLDNSARTKPIVECLYVRALLSVQLKHTHTIAHAYT